MKKLVNAGLKSKKEAALALINGRVFVHKGYQIKFSEDTGANPFRSDAGYLGNRWDEFKHWQEEKEIPWYEDIPEGGAICWVWDDNKLRKRVDLICKYNKKEHYKFRGWSDKWANAEPVKPEECCQEGK